MMTKSRNVSEMGRIIRMCLGAVLIISALAFENMAPGWRLIATLIGAGALVTALVRYCPVNSLLGINECKSSPTSHG